MVCTQLHYRVWRRWAADLADAPTHPLPHAQVVLALRAGHS